MSSSPYALLTLRRSREQVVDKPYSSQIEIPERKEFCRDWNERQRSPLSRTKSQKQKNHKRTNIKRERLFALCCMLSYCILSTAFDYTTTNRTPNSCSIHCCSSLFLFDSLAMLWVSSSLVLDHLCYNDRTNDSLSFFLLETLLSEWKEEGERESRLQFYSHDMKDRLSLRVT